MTRCVSCLSGREVVIITNEATERRCFVPTGRLEEDLVSVRSFIARFRHPYETGRQVFCDMIFFILHRGDEFSQKKYIRLRHPNSRSAEFSLVVVVSFVDVALFVVVFVFVFRWDTEGRGTTSPTSVCFSQNLMMILVEEFVNKRRIIVHCFEQFRIQPRIHLDDR